MKTTVILLALILSSSCATLKIDMSKWERDEKILTSTFIGGQIGDTTMTLINTHNGLEERNPLMPVDQSILFISIKAGVTYGVLWTADRFPEWRKPLLGFGSIIGIGTTAYNIDKLKEN